MHNNVYDEWKRPKSKLDIFLDILAYLLLLSPMIAFIIVIRIYCPEVLFVLIGFTILVSALCWATARIF